MNIILLNMNTIKINQIYVNICKYTIYTIHGWYGTQYMEMNYLPFPIEAFGGCFSNSMKPQAQLDPSPIKIIYRYTSLDTPPGWSFLDYPKHQLFQEVFFRAVFWCFLWYMFVLPMRKPRWCFQIFSIYINLTWGSDPIWPNIFSHGWFNHHLETSSWKIGGTHARWAPASYKWSYGAPINIL